MSWINDAGKVLKSKKGGFYIKFEKGFTVKEGDTMLMKAFEDDVNEKVEKGIINQEKADFIFEKCTGDDGKLFVKYILTKPPSDNG